MKKPEQILASDMARFYADPLGFVLYAFPWGKEEALKKVELLEPWSLVYGARYGPDRWVCEMLDDIGGQVRAQHGIPIRFATGSGHGVGKTALVAWLILWIMSTRPYCRGVVTANTAEQLSTKTWAELAKWLERCITRHWFELTTGRGSMRFYNRRHKDTWFTSAQTAREENSESFAGLHAADSTPFYIFDEAAAIPEKICETAQGGLTDGEPMWFVFGNLTRNTGFFYNCFHANRARWTTRHVDSRTVQVTNKLLLEQWEKDYGEDSDFFKVRVRGIAPSSSTRQFIDVDRVEAAYGRELRPEQYSFAPVILTCDPAWEGDDELVIAMRQGLHFKILRVIPKNNNDLQIAQILRLLEEEHKADAVFVDGGFGTGIVSAGRTMGRDWTIVWFSAKPSQPQYMNKRAEMWDLTRLWLADGGSIPKDQRLYDDLIGPETMYRDDGKLLLESKQSMKARGIPSPNRGDALALSFAYPVSRGTHSGGATFTKQTEGEYDPFARLDHEMGI